MKTRKNTVKSFYMGGLVFSSELELAGLPADEETPVDVTIRIGQTPHVLSDATEIESGCLANDVEYLHTLPGVAVFYINGVSDIVVQPLDETRSGEMRSFLQSAVFAVLFYRRGFLPLHASAVSVNGRVFAFLGSSGAGKSSLAAFLGRRGHQVIADDLCLLQSASNGVTLVTPSFPWVKLWEETLDGLGIARDKLKPVDGKYSKYLLPIAGSENDMHRTLPLGGLFVLQQGTKAMGEIAPMTGVDAVASLMEHTYPRPLIHKLHEDGTLFKCCVDILGTASVSTFRRPWDLADFDNAVDYLLASISTNPIPTML